MTFVLGDDADAIKNHSGVQGAIRRNFEDNAPVEVSATHIAAILIDHAIRRLDDTPRKQAIEQELSAWAALDVEEQRALRRQLAVGNLEEDMLLFRCKWILLMAQDFLVEEKIELQDFRILKDGIYGSLKGDTPDSRDKARIMDAVDDILCTSTRTPT